MKDSAEAPVKKKRSWWPRLILYSFIVLAGAAVAIPNFVKARSTECKNACINNLRQIDGAKEQWALESKAEDGAPVNEQEVNQYLKGGARPECPDDGVYTYNVVGQAPACSFTGHQL